MDVRDERSVHAALEAGLLDRPEALRILDPWRRDAHDLAAGLSQPYDLGHGGIHILGIRRRHRLNADRIRPTDPDVPDAHFPAAPARPGERAFHVAQASLEATAVPNAASASSMRVTSVPPP